MFFNIYIFSHGLSIQLPLRRQRAKSNERRLRAKMLISVNIQNWSLFGLQAAAQPASGPRAPPSAVSLATNIGIVRVIVATVPTYLASVAALWELGAAMVCESGDNVSSFTLSRAAYAVALSHALKHESRATLGVLLGTFEPDNECVRIARCVPAFHNYPTTPVIQICLEMVGSRSAHYYDCSSMISYGLWLNPSHLLLSGRGFCPDTRSSNCWRLQCERAPGRQVAECVRQRHR